MSKFTELLTQKRLEKGLTKLATAEKFGWTRMYYSRFENGSLLPTTSNFRKFANFLEIEEQELHSILKS